MSEFSSDGMGESPPFGAGFLFRLIYSGEYRKGGCSCEQGAELFEVVIPIHVNTMKIIFDKVKKVVDLFQTYVKVYYEQARCQL